MQIARHGAIELAYETFSAPGGASDGEPLLLISGTGVQMLMWPDAFVAALAGRGFCVTRFDNRDAGLSTHLTEAGNPGWLKPLIRHAAAPYQLEDMAGDAAAVLDALGWDRAHIAGASLGGMIAQTMAIRHPSRVRTLTSIMSTPSARTGTMPKISTMRTLMAIAGTPANGPEEAAEAAVALKRLTGTARYPIDEELIRDIGRRSYQRDPGSEAGDFRQRAAVSASGSRRKALAGVRIPTLILHGARLDHPPGHRADPRRRERRRVRPLPGRPRLDRAARPGAHPGWAGRGTRAGGRDAVPGSADERGGAPRAFRRERDGDAPDGGPATGCDPGQ